MESLLLNDPSLSQSKQTKNSKKKPISNNNHHHRYHGMTCMPNISRHKSCSAIHQNYAPSPHLQLEMVQSALGDGMFLNHCRKQYSLPPILPTYYQPHHYHHHQQQPQPQPQPQPPLLPLPFVSNPTFRSLPTSTTPRKKSNKPKATTNATTTKEIRKPLPHQKLKKENKKSDDQVVEGARKGIIEPTPVSDPKESETRVLADTDPNNNNNNNNSEVVTKDEIPPLVLSLLASPPPSSLPLPKFTIKRQNKSSSSSLSCNAEAAADKVATDNLCRLLKLR